MNRIISLILFSGGIFFSSPLCSQSFINGKVIDKENKNPIAFSSVSITSSGFGTASREDGSFSLRIQPELAKEKIRISSIGYNNLELSIDSLSRLGVNEHILYLRPSSIQLEEVKVRDTRIEPAELLKEAFAAIPKNYSQSPFNLEFYSKMEVTDSSKAYYTIESVLKTFRKGYVAGAANWSKIVQKRETGISPLPPIHDKATKQNYFPYWPAFDISASDQLGTNGQAGNGFTVFNPKRFSKMYFVYAGVSVFDKDTVVAIEYSDKKKDVEGKAGTLDGHYNGIIYVAVNNLAIVRHTLKIGSRRPTEIIYKKHNDYYYPYFIQAEYQYGKFSILHSIFYRDVFTTNVEVMVNNSKNWHPEDVPYSKEYWDSNFRKR